MGVKVAVAKNYGLDMYQLDMSSLYYGYSYTFGSTVFRANYSNGMSDEFRGTGFKYAADGTPIAGVASSYAILYNGQKLMTVDGASLAVKDVMKAAGTYSTTDDLKLLAAELAGNDSFSGGDGNDVLLAYAGNDVMDGNAGNDKLNGGAGNDKIEGGLGRDLLYGESGSDIFIYRSIKESTVSTAGRDTIFDFTSADDIDLRSIDASTLKTGDQAFIFIGTKAFSGKAGELRYEKKASDTYVYGDINGDKKADFAIHLDDPLTLTKDYFLL